MRRATLSLLILPVTFILGSGCAPEDARGDGSNHASLPPAAIVENPPLPASHPRLVVSGTPLLEIGLAEGPEAYLLHAVRDVARLDDGVIVVLNGVTQELRFFSPAGEHLRTVGGRGGAPSEFREIVSLFPVRHDTVAVHDATSRRLIFLTSSGQHLFRIPVDISPRNAGIVGILPDRSLILVEYEEAAPARDGEVVRGTARFSLHAPDPPFPETIDLFDFPGNEFVGVTTSAGTISRVLRPYGALGLARVANGQIYTGHSQRLGFEIRTGGGVVRTASRMKHTPRILSAKETREFVRSMRDRGILASRLQAYERLRYPEHYPAWDRMQVAPSGHVWLRAVRAPSEAESQAEWLVFRGDGYFEGVVSTPPRFELRRIGEDYLLGVARDGFDIERVQLYGFDWPPAVEAPPS